MIERLKKLQANKGQFSDGGKLFKACKSNSELRNEITLLSKTFLRRSVQGCHNCYMDAYIELININIEKAMLKIKCQFILLAGALLHDVINYDNNLLCSNANITDDLALYHLKTNPNSRKYFQALPENVDELIEAYKLPGEEPDLTEEEKAAIAEAQDKADNEFISVLALALQGGTTKTALKEKYKTQPTVGTKKLTQRLFNEYLSKADAVLKKLPNGSDADKPKTSDEEAEKIDTTAKSDTDLKETSDEENQA